MEVPGFRGLDLKSGRGNGRRPGPPSKVDLREERNVELNVDVQRHHQALAEITYWQI